MEIDMHDVKSHIGRTAHSEHRIEICPVIIHQSAAGMNHSSNLWYAAFEESQRIWVCHHHCRHIIAQQWFQSLNVNESVSI